MELQEQYRFDVGHFSSGSTTEKFLPYYDMKGYSRIDFLFEGVVKLLATGALGGATGVQVWTLRGMQSSVASGTNSSAISSATAFVGKNAASGISATAGCREGWLCFTTIAADAAMTVSVGTADYVSNTAMDAVHLFACEASANATVAVEGFVAMFNSTVYNTSTVVTANWMAATDNTVAADPWVRIIPRDPGGTHTLRLGTTAANTSIGVGGVFTAHIGIDACDLGEGKRYVSLGVKSSINTNPYVVTVIRKPEYMPAVNTFSIDKTLAGSTGK
jgi:hypothetical protein